MDSADPPDQKAVCGRSLGSLLVFGQDELDRYDSETWYEQDEKLFCNRPVWADEDTDRCIWHADIENKAPMDLAAAATDGPDLLDRAILSGVDMPAGASFAGCRLRRADLANAGLAHCNLRDASLSGADLSGANFFEADLNGANLTMADLRGVYFQFANLSDCNLVEADLSDANLHDANVAGATLRLARLHDTRLWTVDLTDAEMVDADLRDADLFEATLADADLERANLSRANLFGVDLTGTKLYGAVLSDVQLNTDTAFGAHYTGDGGEDPAPDKAAWTLRQLERLFRENALPAKAREAYLSRKDRRRRQYWAAGDYGRALLTTGYGTTMRYGESPWRVVGISVATVLVGALLYPLWGLRVGKAGEAVTTIGYPFESVGVVAGLGKSLYFSVITFTTLGYGDVQPLGFGEAVATVESFVGALLLALLVFVLGRRATW